MSGMAKKSRGGRPTSFREEYVEQARKLCLVMNATDEQLAAFFGVTETTINNWKKRHPAFLEALKRGKAGADMDVAASLYNQAVGFTRTVEKVVKVKGGGEAVIAVEEYVPPNVTACIFWLKNRQPAQWRDVQVREHDGAVWVFGDPGEEDADQWAKEAAAEKRKREKSS